MVRRSHNSMVADLDLSRSNFYVQGATLRRGLPRSIVSRPVLMRTTYFSTSAFEDGLCHLDWADTCLQKFHAFIPRMTVHIQQRCNALNLAPRQDSQAHGQKKCSVVRKQHTSISTFSTQQYDACLSTAEFVGYVLWFTHCVERSPAPEFRHSPLHPSPGASGQKKGNA